MALALRLEHIAKSFRGPDGLPVRVLSDLTLDLPAGTLAVLTGPSGSGKSTLLNIAGLMDRPDAGRVILDGQDATDLPDAARSRLRGQKIGFVFQRFHLLPRRTALQNVLFRFRYASPPPGLDPRKAALAALDRVGMLSLANRPAGVLSAGEMQRIAIARAIVLPPAILLADEPTGNLDPSTAATIQSLFQSLNSTGLTILLVTHSPTWSLLPHTMLLKMPLRQGAQQGVGATPAGA